MQRNFAQILELKTDTQQSKAALAELSASVELLYQVFAAYKLRSGVDRCTHCVTEEDEQRLHSKPLLQLMPEELDDYGLQAMTTWGDADHFKHFLPRFLEFYPFIGTGVLHPEIVFSKLTYGGWRQWPQIEQDSLEAYFYALWKFSLSSIEPTPWTYSENFLCAIAQAADDLRPYLTYWQHSDEPIALRNLAAFIEQNCDKFRPYENRKMVFWEDRIEQWNQLVDWLKNKETLKYFADKMKHTPDLEEELRDVLEFAQKCVVQ